MEEFYSRIHKNLSRELPFVIYRKPGENKVKALLQKEAGYYKSEDLTESGFVFAPFDDRRDTLLIPVEHAHTLELTYEKLSEADLYEDSNLTNQIQKGETNFSLMEKENHLQLVEKAVNRLKAGDLKKVVLSRQEQIPLIEEDPLKIFRDLLALYPAAFVYCWSHPASGTWVGATPETLLHAEGLNFRTMALAATRKYTGTLEVNWGEKEKLEQGYVTEAILGNIRELKMDDKLSVSETYTSRAGGVVHLRTDIEGKMGSSEDLGRLVRTLHPTPAVCGLPREEAREYILKEEGYDREYYTGFLGELNIQEKSTRSRSRRNTENLAYGVLRKKSSLFVNLRCMKLEPQKAVIFVGGGITADSSPEEEFQETVNKAQTMRRVLGASD